MLKGFGEPCLDKAECQSNICIFVGTGGRCTDLCAGGSCPADWGCFGVVDIIEPGSVHDVCVPVIDQLCSACTGDPECTQVGQDRCLTYPDGKRFCGRDCRNVACPGGYTCEDMSAGGTVIRQCVPQSGACDCDATSTGTTEACTIMTPFSTTCAGSRTCQGATGWGACAPPSTTDEPDGNYQDANCDGIDGDVTRGIFVAGGGANTATCGLTAQTPCQTISHGIVRAAQAARTEVFVQTGTYNEVVVLLNGIDVWGGYSFSWQRGPYSNPAHRVTITGGLDSGTGGASEYLTVRAHNLIVPVTIGDVVLNGPNASGTVDGNGRSSYVVHVNQATVRLERVQLVAGSGAAGAAGDNGLNAATVTAQSHMHGAVGGDGDEYVTACDDSTRGGGGARGTNTCSASPSSRDMDGGAGGRGGTMDTNCSILNLNYNARAGDAGSHADYRNGSFGQGGGGGSGGESCGATGNGGPGEVANGAGGTRQSGGTIATGYWYGRPGNPGGTGENGGGGGGGGGAGGCDQGTDSYGGGGGGGGAGGCAARGGGGGGGGGGGSFGVVAVGNSTVTLDVCQITRGAGGAGGAGGSGGRGQDGGLGRSGGAHPGGAMPGVGGGGGHGGHGGGGAGGQGGRSVGLLWTAGSSVDHNCTINAGSPGAAGPAGQHAPSAPIRDGNDGQVGLAGPVEATRQCASTTSC
ncbi:MAG: hypothetical protein KJZ91_17360 [Myxococcales bacterium]|nr:hypothetical protein [Myxococcales bacterium]